MKMAAVQMVSTPDVARNLDAAARLLAEAAAAGAELALLPEYFCLMGRRDSDKLAVAETPGDGPIQRFLADQARLHRLWLVGGTLPLRLPNELPGATSATADATRVRNACCVYAPDGQLAARYDKMHLFAYDNGRERYDEGVALQAGGELVALRAGPLRVGLSICYDLRFPELYRTLSFAPGQPPCDLICVPAAFTHTTGQAHWELLLRARAVENQCYVIAAAQGGLHENGRRTWGHSLVIDPWGRVLAELAEGEGLVLAEIDTGLIASVREQLPALRHRRL
jgi:nitrilase